MYHSCNRQFRCPRMWNWVVLSSSQQGPSLICTRLSLDFHLDGESTEYSIACRWYGGCTARTIYMCSTFPHTEDRIIQKIVSFKKSVSMIGGSRGTNGYSARGHFIFVKQFSGIDDSLTRKEMMTSSEFSVSTRFPYSAVCRL